MHDTDRTLAELAALDQSELEGNLDFDLEAELEDLETLDNLNEFEFEAEGDFEGESFDGPQYEDEQYEGEFEGPQYEGAQYEATSPYDGEASFESEEQFEDESGFQPEFESTVGEAAQMELAAELLELENDQELEYFLGDLIKSAVSKIGAALKSPVGKQLVGMLKDAAGKILPVAGSVVGGILGGPAGSMIGGNIASNAGNILGLELEGLAQEDQEFETAKAFVRLATDAAREAATAPPNLDPATVAQSAMERAASRHAPGLLATASPSPAFGTPYQFHHRRRRLTGRWVRVSRNQIVLHGL